MIQIMEQKDFDSLLMLIKGQTERMNMLEEEIRVLKNSVTNMVRKIKDTQVYGPGYQYAPAWQNPPAYDPYQISCDTVKGQIRNSG